MSLNALPIDKSSCDFYDESSRGSNCSSLRVRFRMITRKSSAVQSSHYNSSGNMPAFTRGIAAESYSLHPAFMRQNVRSTVEYRETKTVDKSFFYYNHSRAHKSQQRHQKSSYAQAIPINIGVPACRQIEPTTKTFQLTEDLNSNIKFDVTLNPSLSIRDDRIDASNRAVCDSYCEVFSSAPDSSFRKSPSANVDTSNDEESDYYRQNCSARSSRHSFVTRYYQTMPSTHSSLIKLSFNEPTSMRTSVKIHRGSNEARNAKTPFTFIETYSTRRKMSLSPRFNNNSDLINKARNQPVTYLLTLIFFCLNFFKYLNNFFFHILNSNSNRTSSKVLTKS